MLRIRIGSLMFLYLIDWNDRQARSSDSFPHSISLSIEQKRPTFMRSS